MASVRIVIRLGDDLLAHVDRWVAERRYLNRSQAVQAALREKLERGRRRRLPEEATKLDPKEERALAEEGFAAESEIWPAAY